MSALASMFTIFSIQAAHPLMMNYGWQVIYPASTPVRLTAATHTYYSAHEHMALHHTNSAQIFIIQVHTAQKYSKRQDSVTHDLDYLCPFSHKLRP